MPFVSITAAKVLIDLSHANASNQPAAEGQGLGYDFAFCKSADLHSAYGVRLRRGC
jgi:hypothetical protein